MSLGTDEPPGKMRNVLLSLFPSVIVLLVSAALLLLPSKNEALALPTPIAIPRPPPGSKVVIVVGGREHDGMVTSATSNDFSGPTMLTGESKQSVVIVPTPASAASSLEEIKRLGHLGKAMLPDSGKKDKVASRLAKLLPPTTRHISGLPGNIFQTPKIFPGGKILNNEKQRTNLGALMDFRPHQPDITPDLQSNNGKLSLPVIGYSDGSNVLGTGLGLASPTPMANKINPYTNGVAASFPPGIDPYEGFIRYAAENLDTPMGNVVDYHSLEHYYGPQHPLSPYHTNSKETQTGSFPSPPSYADSFAYNNGLETGNSPPPPPPPPSPGPGAGGPNSGYGVPGTGAGGHSGYGDAPAAGRGVPGGYGDGPAGPGGPVGYGNGQTRPGGRGYGDGPARPDGPNGYGDADAPAGPGGGYGEGPAGPDGPSGFDDGPPGPGGPSGFDDGPPGPDGFDDGPPGPDGPPPEAPPSGAGFRNRNNALGGYSGAPRGGNHNSVAPSSSYEHGIDHFHAPSPGLDSAPPRPRPPASDPALYEEDSHRSPPFDSPPPGISPYSQNHNPAAPYKQYSSAADGPSNSLSPNQDEPSSRHPPPPPPHGHTPEPPDLDVFEEGPPPPGSHPPLPPPPQNGPPIQNGPSAAPENNDVGDDAIWGILDLAEMIEKGQLPGKGNSEKAQASPQGGGGAGATSRVVVPIFTRPPPPRGQGSSSSSPAEGPPDDDQGSSSPPHIPPPPPSMVGANAHDQNPRYSGAGHSSSDGGFDYDDNDEDGSGRPSSFGNPLDSQEANDYGDDVYSK